MEKTAYLSCVAIAVSTIVELTAVICGSNWDGWAVPCAVLYYVGVVVALFAAVLPCASISLVRAKAPDWIMMHHEHVDLKRVSAPLLYPSVAMTSSAAAGAVVVQNAGLSARLALPVVILSYILAGLGLLTALLIQAVFVARLVEHSVPEAPKKPTLFLMIAPLATAGCTLTDSDSALI